MTSSGLRLTLMNPTLAILVTVLLKNKTPAGEREPGGSQRKAVCYSNPSLLSHHPQCESLTHPRAQ